jgi:hypothetical protein
MEPAMYAHSTYRDLAAKELRRAAALRRDMVLGLLPRGPAISAIRDSLRQAHVLTFCGWLVHPRGLE